MLIDQDRVPIRIREDQARRTRGGLIGRHSRFEPPASEYPLNIAHVVKVAQRVPASIPPGIERQHVPRVLRPLKEPDGAGRVLQDQPVLRLIARDLPEAELFIERPRCGDVLDDETDGEVAEFQGTLS